MRVYTLGAYDRFNFGDLCFPHVWDAAVAAVRPDAVVTHCGVSAVDMRAAGGHRVLDVRQAFPRAGEQSRARVVVGGGEVVGAGWYGLLTSLSTPQAGVARRLRRSPRGLRERLAGTVLGARWEFPFLPPASEFGRIAYSTIGASHTATLSPAEQSRRWGNLVGAAYVSVRDRVSLRLAQAHGVDARLAPDSVAALFDLPVFRGLLPAASGPRPATRVVLQASERWVATNRRDAVRSVRELAGAGIELRLLPVGLAPAHSDREGLASLASAVRGGVSVVPVATVQDIVSTIRSADVVVASSLHASIAAMAAGRPHIGLTGVPKLTSYLATWALPSSAVPARAGQLGRQVTRLLAEPELDARRDLAGRLARLAADDSAAVARSVVDDS